MQFTESIDGEGAASTASALINPNDAISLWVEIAPVAARAKRAARAAMQIESGLPAGVARNFPVDFVSVGDTEKPCIERINHVELAFSRGTPGHNSYGPDPLAGRGST